MKYTSIKMLRTEQDWRLGKENITTSHPTSSIQARKMIDLVLIYQLHFNLLFNSLIYC